MAKKKTKNKTKQKVKHGAIPVNFIFAVIAIVLVGVTLKGWEPIGTRYISAYNSVPGQTDDTPCLAARGDDICRKELLGEQTCAANFVPIGTRLWVEGMGSCIVWDRMNSRYTSRIDWYMGMDVDQAKVFGIQKREVWKKDFGWLKL